MLTKKFKLEAGTLHVKTKQRPDSDAPFGIQYSTKKNGIKLKISGYYSAEWERDEKFGAFKRVEAQDFLRGMHDFVGQAAAKPKPGAKTKPSTKKTA